MANKNPIRSRRTGLHAITRLRFGEERFRRGQDANVHRFVVPGGGPFFTARCRDCFTHSLPQETSAGRNLITVFLPVNNLTQFFFAPAPCRNSVRGGIARRSCSRASLSLRRALSPHTQKVLIFRDFHVASELDRVSDATTRDVREDFLAVPTTGFDAPFFGLDSTRRFRVAQADLRETARKFSGVGGGV
ncbi:MAG TPA: hypothetical protein VGD42_08935 [Lysobacter sp.]